MWRALTNRRSCARKLQLERQKPSLRAQIVSIPSINWARCTHGLEFWGSHSNHLGFKFKDGMQPRVPPENLRQPTCSDQMRKRPLYLNASAMRAPSSNTRPVLPLAPFAGARNSGRYALFRSLCMRMRVHGASPFAYSDAAELPTLCKTSDADTMLMIAKSSGRAMLPLSSPVMIF